MTPRQALAGRIIADARNIAWVKHNADGYKHRAKVTADCAARYIAAKDMGDAELYADAEMNLREAAALWEAAKGL